MSFSSFIRLAYIDLFTIFIQSEKYEGCAHINCPSKIHTIYQKLNCLVLRFPINCSTGLNIKAHFL